MGRESRVTKLRPQGNPEKIELKERGFSKELKNCFVKTHTRTYYINDNGTYRQATINELVELERQQQEKQKLMTTAKPELDRINNGTSRTTE